MIIDHISDCSSKNGNPIEVDHIRDGQKFRYNPEKIQKIIYLSDPIRKETVELSQLEKGIENKTSFYKKNIERYNEPIKRGNIEKPLISLTFDDGNAFVEEILDELDTHNIQATFFVT